MATVVAGSAKRAIAWARPRGVRYIAPVELGIARLEKAMERRKGPLYQALNECPAFRGKDDDTARSRRMRRDGLRNMISLFQAIIAAADITTGFVGSPRGEARWERHTWAVIDSRAFGVRVEQERSFRRTQRHARALAALGLVDVAELRIPAGVGKWRSVAAIKRITAAGYELLGLASAVARARRERDRQRGEQRAKALVELVQPSSKRPTSAPGAPASSASAPTSTPRPKPPDPGPAPPSAAESIAAAKAILGIR